MFYKTVWERIVILAIFNKNPDQFYYKTFKKFQHSFIIIFREICHLYLVATDEALIFY